MGLFCVCAQFQAFTWQPGDGGLVGLFSWKTREPLLIMKLKASSDGHSVLVLFISGAQTNFGEAFGKFGKFS